MGQQEIETLRSRKVYENRWMVVREDEIRRANGTPGIYGVVEKPDFAVIVPLQGDTTTLVQQYRYPVGERYWEFPQGSWEQSPISPEDLAKAELKEETGLRADHVAEVGHLYVAYGFSNQGYRIFLATGLHREAVDLDDEEVGLVSQEFRLDQVRDMILSGEIKDAATVAAFGILQIRGLLRSTP